MRKRSVPPTPDPSPPLRGGRGVEAHAPVLRRASTIVHAGHWDVHHAVDSVVLDADERHLRRTVLTGQGGLTLLLDLPHATVLHHGDGLVLDDGGIVQVAGKPELLVEVSAGSHAALLRLAWHIGNRHTALQVVGHALRIRRDHVLEAMLQGLGATLTPTEAPFEPEQGAYAEPQYHGHHHDHG
jgi:urease accessory protein